MSDNQSWNSSGSEEDLDTDPGLHGGGVAEFSGVLSKVNKTEKGGGENSGNKNTNRVFTIRLEPRLGSHTSAPNVHFGISQIASRTASDVDRLPTVVLYKPIRHPGSFRACLNVIKKKRARALLRRTT